MGHISQALAVALPVSGLNIPAAQSWHALAEVDPLEGLKLPTGHKRHREDPEAEVKVPEGQAAQKDWPEMEVVPGGHNWHVDCPTMGLNDPAAHGRQAPMELEPEVAEKVPVGQAVQAVRPSLEA